MCFLPKSTSVSSARPRLRPLFRLRPPPAAPLAVLDLSQPGERAAHDFVRRFSSGRDASWRLLGMGRQGSTLLCVVRWRQPENPAAAFSLAEVSLSHPALCWRSYPSADAARQEMERRCTTTQRPGGAP